MNYIIKDWADNTLFKGKTFKTFEDAWGFIYETIKDETYYEDLFVEESK